VEGPGRDRVLLVAVPEAALARDEIVYLVEPGPVSMEPPVPSELSFVPELVDEDYVLERKSDDAPPGKRLALKDINLRYMPSMAGILVPKVGRYPWMRRKA